MKTNGHKLAKYSLQIKIKVPKPVTEKPLEESCHQSNGEKKSELIL